MSVVWGRVPPEPELCSSVPRHANELIVVAGVAAFATFTACDAEDMPVAHGLPTGNDDRRFTALLRDLGGSPIVTYRGEGERSSMPFTEELTVVVFR